MSLAAGEGCCPELEGHQLSRVHRGVTQTATEERCKQTPRRGVLHWKAKLIRGRRGREMRKSRRKSFPALVSLLTP